MISIHRTANHSLMLYFLFIKYPGPTSSDIGNQPLFLAENGAPHDEDIQRKEIKVDMSSRLTANQSGPLSRSPDSHTLNTYFNIS